ncbi:hypothetical protein [Roseimicrobium sp. ORNL1]|uniref:hypothetical protein n=1 Tax=Roseimicrobium sp. ORNL1 TaxID=2711231 RepID=UPI0013E13274|nr:hypothetical protein [Roseimicrobium sp. ORNL1]QIF04437.1 hypothetical protein G5S37_23895 [Roseimicrobium sp. ORNL1]
MEWIVLAILAPLIVVPVVLLFGYAGCGDFIATDIISVPKLTFSYKIDGTTVTLTWSAGPPGTTKYRLLRGLEGENLEEITPGPDAQTQYADTGRTELARYFYVVYGKDGANKTTCESKQLIVDIPPLPPTNVAAAATGPNTVHLTWKNNPDARMDRVVIRRLHVSTAAEEETDIPRAETYDDTTPSAVTDFSYQVAARYSADDGTGISLTSIFAPEPPLRVDGLPPENFTLAFPSTPNTPNRVSPSLGGDCIIQRISKDELQAGGNRLRITFRATNGLGFTAVTISQPASTGNDWDSHTDLTVIATNLDLSGAQPMVRTLDYTLDEDQDVLIAFNMRPEDDLANAPITDNVPGCTVYYLADNRDAVKIGARDPNFATFTNTLAIVEKIEVVVA